MSSSFDTFHATYSRGQRFEWGEQPQLLELLEGMGGGLPTDDSWQGGGPMLIDFSKRRQILAWIRGIPNEVNRDNAWQAWGIIGPAGSFFRWPTFWRELSTPPDRERLDGIADHIRRDRKGKSLPPIPENLGEVLETIYLSDASSYFLPMREADDVPLLAWAYMFGPVPHTSATVGPPRRLPVVMQVPLTYQGQIEDKPFPADMAPLRSPLLASVVDAARSNDLESAIATVMDLRQMNAAQRRQKVLAVPAKTPPPVEAPWKEVPVQQQTAEHQSSQKRNPELRAIIAVGQRLEKLEQWVIAGGVALAGLLLILVFANIYYFRQISAKLEKIQPTVTDSSGTPGPTGTETIATASSDTVAITSTVATATAPVVTAVACDGWWLRPDSQNLVRTRLRDKFGKTATLRLSDGVAGQLAENAAWGTGTAGVLANVSKQIQLTEARCYSGRIDADVRTDIEACRRQGNTIQTEREPALQWLCGWAQR